MNQLFAIQGIKRTTSESKWFPVFHSIPAQTIFEAMNILDKEIKDFSAQFPEFQYIFINAYNYDGPGWGDELAKEALTNANPAPLPEEK